MGRHCAVEVRLGTAAAIRRQTGRQAVGLPAEGPEMIQCDYCGRKAPKPGNHVRWYLLSKDSRIPFLLCWQCREETLKEHPETVDIVEVRGRYVNSN